MASRGRGGSKEPSLRRAPLTAPPRVRLAVHTYPFRDLPLEEALDEVASLGATDVEVWLGHARETPSAVLRALERRHLRAVAVGAGGFYRLHDDTPERAFSLAEAIGAPTVVACLPPAVTRRLSGRVPQGIVLCVENHWDQPLARPHEILAAIEGTELRACLDTGHGLLAGVRPDRYAETLGSRLGHLHLNDGRLPTLLERLLGRRLRKHLCDKPRPVAPGEGELDVAALRRALGRIGFDATVSIEYEGAHPAAALALLKHLWEAGAASEPSCDSVAPRL